jgi:hypothetical protein
MSPAFAIHVWTHTICQPAKSHYGRRGTCACTGTASLPGLSYNLPSLGWLPISQLDLGGDDCPLPPAAAAGEPVADDGFRLARLAAVAVGSVEEVNPLLMGNGPREMACRVI